MTTQRNILLMVATLLCGVLLSGCTVKEWSEERVVRKAEIWLDYSSMSEDVRLLLFAESLYRDSLMSGVGGEDSEPSRVTYLYNNTYTAVSVSQPLDCDLSVDGVLSGSCFEARQNQGFYLPVGDVYTDIFSFSIVKGESKPFAPSPVQLTTGMTLTVKGLQWLDNPEGLRFEYDYATGALLDGTPIAERGTYCPEVEIESDEMTGAWRTFYGAENPDFVIRLVAWDGEVLYEKNIKEQMAEHSDVDVEVNILIEFSQTQIRCTVADWTETVERMIVDIE